MTPNLLTSCRRRCGFPVAAAVACLIGGVAVSDAQEQAMDLAPPAQSARDYRPPEDPQELLRIDESIRNYFAQRIPRRSSEHAQLSAIVDAIFQTDADGLNFVYDAAGTFDVRETFRRRQGNCASFAFLVVAVAREFGLHASFHSVERPLRWDRVGGVVVAVLHLGAKITTREGTYVIDLEPNVVRSRGTLGMHVVRDETACAMFYGNIGFAHLLQDRPLESLRYMTLATTVDPQCGSAWANRATLHARMGDLAAARIAFERSLRADPDGEAALDGYVSLLRRLGKPEDLRRADKLERKVRAIRDRNPYYQQELARLAQERGDPVSAEKYLRRALSLKRDESELYVQWIAVLEQLGRNDDARRAARKLEKLDKLHDRLAVTPVEIRP